MNDPAQNPEEQPSVAEHVKAPDVKTTRKRKTEAVKVDPGPLTLSYSLAELPSAQHRAGLAGLVLFVRWLGQQRAIRGICELPSVNESGATIRLDQEGVRGIFDELYAASEEEKEEKQPRKDKEKNVVAPLRTDTREVTVTDKNGKTTKKTETFYYYPAIVPKAPFLVALEPTRSEDGPWVKLWRDMLWQILRGVPATRSPYEDRTVGSVTDDADATFASLARPLDHASDLSSTLYLGAQACTAENVSFRDRSRYQFLLHFWPLLAQIYVPRVWNEKQGRFDFLGYAIAIPDVAQLHMFTRAWQQAMLNGRTAEKIAYRPKQAVVDLSVEGALDLAERLSEALAALEGEKRTGRAVLGIEVLHMNKDGNNVRLLSSERIDPSPRKLREYVQIKKAFRDHVFRRQRLLNLVKGRPWFAGFDALAQVLPIRTQFFGSAQFRHDAKLHFETQRKDMEQQSHDPTAPQSDHRDQLSQIIYRLTQAYVRRKTESKGKKREDIARDAFLAVRSRTGTDFVEYFCGTLCSVPQAISSADFQRMGRTLRDEEGRAELRTLTLLALSAAAFTGFDKKTETGSGDAASTESV